MRRALFSIALVLSGFSAAGAADQCGNAYVKFMERLSVRTHEISAPRLAALHRQAVRIFQACDTGHLGNAEERLRSLEAS